MPLDLEKLRTAILEERQRLHTAGRDLDGADVIDVVEKWLRGMPSAWDALMFIDKIIGYKIKLYDHPPEMTLAPAARAMLLEMRVHVQAAMARLERGDLMEPLDVV